MPSNRRAACSRHVGCFSLRWVCRVLIPAPEGRGGRVQNAGGGLPLVAASCTVSLWCVRDSAEQANEPEKSAAMHQKCCRTALFDDLMPVNYFLVRVVLRHNASLADYENLHARMEARFFYRKIQGSDGTWYDLPPAEYQCSSQAGTPQSIREQAAEIARTVDPSVRVRVTQGMSAWVGLDQSAFQGGATVQPALPILNYLSLPSPFPAPNYQPEIGTLLSALIAPPPPYR
jgi:hypothetical protein